MEFYDVFISFRNTDANGCQTPDTAMAEVLYHTLRAKGYNPFFSKYSVDSNGRADFIALINNALETAKVLIAVATSRENLTSRWVKREINMFSALMMREPEGARTLVTYRSEDFLVSELPPNLADLQSFTDEKAIVRFTDVVLRGADGFCNDGSSTEILYATNTSCDESTNHMGQGLQVGEVLDNRYSILQMIGQGGTSTVFFGVDERTNRQVAVKEVRKLEHKDFSLLQKDVAHELDIMRNLHHPSLPELIDALFYDDSLVIVMEYIPGLSLQMVLEERGAQTEAFTLNIARQLAEVLDYMHTLHHSVIYRDLKPANVIIKPDGKIKLVDFGTARYYKENLDADTINLGTVGYAAPEQYGGMGQTDARTDIYGLGVTLYYLVTGKDPTKPPYEIMPIRQINSNLSKGLEILIRTCTQKNPDLRYQSAKELLEALDHIHKLGKYSLFPRKSKSKPAPKSQYPVPQLQQPHIIPRPPVVMPKVTNADILEKFSGLDPESQQIVRQLINRLSK